MSGEHLFFRAEAERLLLAVGFLSELRLDEMADSISLAATLGPFVDPTADAISLADTLGPFVDPTYREMLYRNGNMHDVARLVTLAKPLVAEFRSLRDKLNIPAASS